MDQEWIALMEEAKALGMTVEEVRDVLEKLSKEEVV